MRLIEQFDSDGDHENGIPEAWCGCYAEFSLKAAGALIGSGKTEEGFALLDKTFALYERWNRIPAGKLMTVGNRDAFGEVYVNKSESDYLVHIHFADGQKVWTPYLWLFWQLKGDILTALTQWPWFDGVKDDPRYTEALARARAMAEAEQ